MKSGRQSKSLVLSIIMVVLVGFLLVTSAYIWFTSKQVLGI